MAGDDQGHHGDVERPWLEQELDGPAPIGDDALAVLRGHADPAARGADVWRAGPSTLAAATTTGTSHSYYAASINPGDALLITPVVRPADVPGRVGWLGPLNHDLTGAEVSTVLRSWEDRFGACLMTVDFATLSLQVASPPQEPEHAHAVALEQAVFRPDAIDQGVGSIEALAEQVPKLGWHFWWD